MSISTPRYALASLECARSLQNRLLASSREAGWTSCVLDHVEGDHAAGAHETRATPDLTIVVATRGEHDFAVFRNGRWRSAVYQGGAVGINAGGETVRLKWSNRNPRTPFRTAHLYIPQAFIAEAADFVSRPGQRLSSDIASILVMEERVVASTVSALVGAMERGETDFHAETGLRWLSLHLMSHFGERGERGGRRRRTGDAVLLTDARLARAIEFMTTNLARPVTVADVAHEAGVSPFHFARLFARRLGIPPHAYLTRCRMEQARTLLATTELPVAAVAAECGYTTPGSFSSAYLRHFGQQPSTVRKRL